MFEGRQRINAGTVGRYLSDADLTRAAVDRLRQAGFDILQVTALTINIAAPARTYERAFKTRIVAEERQTLKERGRKDKATFLDSPDTKIKGLISTRGTAFEDVLEGVALEEPRYLFAPSMFAPTKPYWHLRVPGDVSLGCNADRAHRDGITGRGVRVAMVDSGWYRHPFFVHRGYRAAPVVLGPATSDPLKDEVGHGTGESANIFAVAPDVELLPVKALLAGSLGTVLVNSTGAFNAAVALNPDIITCSWGFHIPNGPLSAAEQALAAAVAAAVASGITVIFSAGNGHAGFRRSIPTSSRPAARSWIRTSRCRRRTTPAASEQHLFEPPGAGRMRPRRYAAEGYLHHAAARAGDAIDVRMHPALTPTATRRQLTTAGRRSAAHRRLRRRLQVWRR